MSTRWPLVLLLAMGCATEDRSGLERRRLEVPAQSGWARIRMDGAAQAKADSLWIGDAGGTSIPFLTEREGLWTPQDLETQNLLLGRNEAGQPSAEFGLKLPEGWRVREREHLRLHLELEGKAPWAARVKVERQHQGGAWLQVETALPPFVYDLGDARGKSSLTLPWDGDRYRISLQPAQGRAPALKGLRVVAQTVPEALDVDERLTAFDLKPMPAKDAGLWRVDLSAPERVVAVDVHLRPPVAPVYATFQFPREPDPIQRPPTFWGSGPVWNLPALQAQSTRVALPPHIVKTFLVQLPQNVALERLELMVRREALLFPAEAGQTYFLHLGGVPKQAPGNLGALPPSRDIYTKVALALQAPEPDPQGLGRRIEGGERTRGWLPWAVGGVVGLLLLVAGSFLKPDPA
jgi:hypothetical protein